MLEAEIANLTRALARNSQVLKILTGKATALMEECPGESVQEEKAPSLTDVEDCLGDPNEPGYGRRLRNVRAILDYFDVEAFTSIAPENRLLSWALLYEASVGKFDPDDVQAMVDLLWEKRGAGMERANDHI